jgi:hypothetical protein
VPVSPVAAAIGGLDGHQFHYYLSQRLVAARHCQRVFEASYYDALFVKPAGGFLCPTAQWYNGKIIIEAVMTDEFAFPLHQERCFTALLAFVGYAQLRFYSQRDGRILCLCIDCGDEKYRPQERSE